MADHCEHKQIIGCALTALPGCCSCADKRPEATAYPVYIDGKGMRLQGKRWQRYCWKCRDHWDLLSQSTISSSLPASAATLDGAHEPSQTTLPQRDNMNPLQWLNNPSLSYDNFDDLAETYLRSIQPSIAVDENNNEAPNHFLLPTRTIHPSQAFQHGQLPAPPAREVRETTSTQMPLRIPIPRSYQPENQAQSSSAPARRRQIPNPFGTREELESDDYQSPLTEMFGRAWVRYQEHETNRQQSPFQAGMDFEASLLLTPAERVEPGTVRVHHQREHAEHGLEPAQDIQVNPIDQQSRRPPPLGSEDMTVSIACRICCEQKIDTLLEPCMHLAICHWCSEVIRDRVRQHRVRRILGSSDDGDSWGRAWQCPICRHGVTKARRVFLA